MLFFVFLLKISFTIFSHLFFIFIYLFIADKTIPYIWSRKLKKKNKKQENISINFPYSLTRFYARNREMPQQRRNQEINESDEECNLFSFAFSSPFGGSVFLDGCISCDLFSICNNINLWAVNWFRGFWWRNFHNTKTHCQYKETWQSFLSYN